PGCGLAGTCPSAPIRAMPATSTPNGVSAVEPAIVSSTLISPPEVTGAGGRLRSIAVDWAWAIPARPISAASETETQRPTAILRWCFMAGPLIVRTRHGRGRDWPDGDRLRI